jgi:hypothetical protein
MVKAQVNIMHLIRMITVLIALMATAGNANAQISPDAQVALADTVIEFGILTQQDSVVKKLTFRNTGKVDLIWFDAVSECGCASIILPQKPVKPGKKGELLIIFKSPYIGTIEKKITMVSNAGIHYVTYHAYVKE